MITGFEKQTHELTDYEKGTILPRLLDILNGRDSIEKAIQSMQIIDLINPHLPEEKAKKLTGARLRKLIAHVRRHSLIKNLVASSRGYYSTTDPAVLAKYIQSLDTRASAIISIKNCLRVSYKELIQHKQAS